MSAVRNATVVAAWATGTTARNHRGSLSTDGGKLWSYGLQIGDTIDGVKVLLDYTANGRWGFQSQTTSCHVGLARRFATHVD